MENEQNIHNEMTQQQTPAEKVPEKTNDSNFGIPQAIVTAAVIIGLVLIFVFAPNKTMKKPIGNKMYSTIEIFASNMGINSDKFEACMDSGETVQTVKDQSNLATPLGVQGTPTSIIMVASTGQQIQIVGAQPIDSIKTIIDTGLEGKKVNITDEQKPSANTQLLPNDHIIGSANAPIVIVEYSDSDCPYCQKFHATMHQIKDNYGDKVAWVYRHYPLDSLHPKARMEAEASECVAKLSNNETFWKYLDAMFTINSSAS
ncbi:MAG: thioredoxin domain-containing protein [Minisyncoccia bacterium]